MNEFFHLEKKILKMNMKNLFDPLYSCDTTALIFVAFQIVHTF